MKLPDTDTVVVYQLSQQTRDALSAALSDSGFDVGESWVDFDTFCGIFHRLKAATDDPELFPKGKWATLQRMEQLIEQAITTSKSTGEPHD